VSVSCAVQRDTWGLLSAEELHAFDHLKSDYAISFHLSSVWAPDLPLLHPPFFLA